VDLSAGYELCNSGECEGKRCPACNKQCDRKYFAPRAQRPYFLETGGCYGNSCHIDGIQKTITLNGDVTNDTCNEYPQ